MVNPVSKITPLVVKTKRNNLFTDGSLVIGQLKHLIKFEALFGVNRLYLFVTNRFIIWLSYIYSLILVLMTFHVLYYRPGFFNASALVIKDTSCVEYTVLVLVSIFTCKSKLRKFFRDLGDFDSKVNISNEYAVIFPMVRGFLWILSSLICNILEYILLATNVYFGNTRYFLAFIYLTTIIHDTEFIFYCTLIRSIFKRLTVLKGHVAKEFCVNEGRYWKEFDKTELLANKTQFDISHLHQVYELLHKCSEELGSFMSLPMMTLLFSSGLSTTVLLRNIFKIVQMDETMDSAILRTMLVYAAIRCIKCTILVIIPCYYSSVTSNQVSIIRTMLHDAVNTMPFSKINRRKMKAFLQLTCDSQFSYAIWGVIELNMSLPLSYTSLCTTYLVIFIQFAKFID